MSSQTNNGSYNIKYNIGYNTTYNENKKKQVERKKLYLEILSKTTHYRSEVNSCVCSWNHTRAQNCLIKKCDGNNCENNHTGVDNCYNDRTDCYFMNYKVPSRFCCKENHYNFNNCRERKDCNYIGKSCYLNHVELDEDYTYCRENRDCTKKYPVYCFIDLEDFDIITLLEKI